VSTAAFGNILNAQMPTGGAVLPDGVLAVRYDAPAGGDGRTWATAYNSIQAAYTAASPGNELWCSGHFVLATTITVKTGVNAYGGFGGFEVAREQRSPQSYPTTVDGNNATRLLSHTQSTGGGSAEFYDFRFVNGYVNGRGAALQTGSYSVFYTYFYDCLFSGNVATTCGAIVNCATSAERPTFTRCVFTGNQAPYGILCGDNFRQIYFNDCLAYQNTATGTAEGWMLQEPYGQMYGCTIVNNNGPVEFYAIKAGSWQVHHSIVYGNGSDFRCGRYGYAYDCDIGVSLTLGGARNISADPLFVAPASGNYRLGAGSPCINSSNPRTRTYDLGKAAGVVGGKIDIGCYEYQE